MASLRRLVLAGVGGAAVLYALAPVPAALLIRTFFNQKAGRTRKLLDRDAPDVESLTVPYRDDLLLDIYRPHGHTGPLPTISWRHGGAWISGGRRYYAGFFRRLSEQGFCVIAPDYRLAPRHRYPAALQDISSVHSFLTRQGESLGVDMDAVVLAGDSAGAQLTLQMALAVADPAYGEEIGVEPALPASALRGPILNCGIYDLGTVQTGGIVGWGVRQVLWAYTGERDFAASRASREISLLHRIGAGFRPVWLSGGNEDPLTEGHSKRLAELLTDVGGRVETLFFDDDLEPGLGHEYQFSLERIEAQQALESMSRFARDVAG